VIEEETPCAPREGLPRRAAVARVPDAGAAAEAARSAGATVCLRRAREVVDEATMRKAEGWLENAGHQNTLFEALTTEGAEWADAILFGTPSYSGAVSTELKA